ncbi:MAG: site-specific DNA-methyltransferase, partial [Anaerolineales bacterium]|nr:site-specific DNA-methyltransferase [Anaerolineales bacterium]
MQALLPEYAGKIDLIYADPPFLTGKAYQARIGHGEDSRIPGDWKTVQGYQDTWRDGGEYLDMLFPRLELMWRLLAQTGSLYLHLDWHASAYARVLLDEIFGPDRLLNEIVWVYHGPSPIRSAFNRKHDTILVYTKSKDYTFNADAVRVPYNPSTVKTFASSDRAGFGKKPDLKRGKVPEDWWYFPVVARMHSERTGYPTQKPEALMERIILSSSNPGDLVADFFCGSGTTPSVASRLNRNWIACDPEPIALQTSYRRMISTEGVMPFKVERTTLKQVPERLEPKVSFEIEGNEVLIHLESVHVRENGNKLDDDHVVLWEIDTHFDDTIFRSHHQRFRPWRTDSLETTMRIILDDPKPACLAVRVMDVKGNTGSTRCMLDPS